VSASDAVQQIQDWRKDFGRRTISNDTWSLIKDEFEPSGHDNDVYGDTPDEE
jgi:hypothetical protein